MTVVPQMCGTFSIVPTTHATALDRLSALLRIENSPTVNTSMRIPENLRDAAALVVDELGLATSTTTLTTESLRFELETALWRASLDALYAQDPASRPSLAQTAHALAVAEDSPVAEYPELIEHAAHAIVDRHPTAEPHDVLLWAEALHSAAST